MIRQRLPVFVLASLAVAACASSDEVASTPTDPTPSTAETTTTSTTTTVVADTTTTVPESTTTVESSTTTAPTTVAPTTTTAAPTATLPGPAPTPPGNAFVASDDTLVQVDVATGAPVATLGELFNGDGLYRGDLRLSPDGASLWFSEGYEDGWYGCESSVGSFGRVDIATGAIELVGRGIGPEPSPDGALLAYIDSTLCLPDPENPEFWVLTPYDRVVVRDLATGSERTFVSQPPPQDYAAPNLVAWAGFTATGELLVRTADEQLRRVDLDGSGVLQDHPVVLEELRGIPVGTTTGGWLVTVDYGDEGSADVFAVDLETGTTARLATSEGFVSAGVSVDGAIVLTGFTEVEVEPDAPVTVLVPPAATTYYDVDW